MGQRRRHCPSAPKSLRRPPEPVTDLDPRDRSASLAVRLHVAAEDADNPATTEEDWADAVIGLPVLKTPVNAKFDADVVDWFKSQGRGYQTRMNAVLRRYMEAQRRTG